VTESDEDLESKDIRKFVQVTMERMVKYFHDHEVPAASMLAATELLMLRTLLATVKKRHWEEAMEAHGRMLREGMKRLEERP